MPYVVASAAYPRARCTTMPKLCPLTLALLVLQPFDAIGLQSTSIYRCGMFMKHVKSVIDLTPSGMMQHDVEHGSNSHVLEVKF